MTSNPSPRLALFGATGRTGRQILLQAKEKSLSVSVLARVPDMLESLRESVSVTAGTVMDLQAVRRVISGSTAVLSVIGRDKGSPADLMTAAAANMITAMRGEHVDRLVVLSNTAIEDPTDRLPMIHRIFRGILPRVNKPLTLDSVAAAKIIEDSGLDWTIVRAPLLTDGPRTSHYRVGPLEAGMPVRISRADVAEFMLSCVLERKFVRDRPAIGSSGLL